MVTRLDQFGTWNEMFLLLKMSVKNLNGMVQRIILNECPTKFSIQILKHCRGNCVHIQMFDIFFAFDSDLLPFSSTDVCCAAAVFQVCKICAFNKSNAFVLIAKCKIFF